MENFTVMRTLLLLNTTQRKLSTEENLYDSSSPLRALQLQKVARTLNSHLHTEQIMQSPSTSSYREAEYRMMDAGIEDDDYESEEAYELGESSLEVTHETVSEVLPTNVELLTPTSKELFHTAEVLDSDCDEDLHELYLDDEDMPSISRQSSREAFDSEEDMSHDEQDHVATAVREFLMTHHESSPPLTTPAHFSPIPGLSAQPISVSA